MSRPLEVPPPYSSSSSSSPGPNVTRGNQNLPPPGSTSSSLPDDNNGLDASTTKPTPIHVCCSVLNTVIDHVMVPPSALEPEELRAQYVDDAVLSRSTELGAASQTRTPLQVPVLRVFGPILRRDNDDSNPDGNGSLDPPTQSACLYIHGAFPYLLCRPVVAGADGSWHRSSHNHHGLTPSGHLDWDDAAAVERILPVLHEHLEASLQASLQQSSLGLDKHSNSNREATGNSRQPPKPPATKIIRRLSLVVGRGFYTYCAGPPAPFVRVEYYNPKSRWKVKMLLERGLELPSLYHPDPIQYEPAAREDHVEPDIDAANAETLSFHCYEAHIPYTMQFFKDYNLAGMRYIHIGKTKFRQPLPRTRRARFWHKHDVLVEPHVRDETMFLESNTPAVYRWNDDTQTNVTLLHVSPTAQNDFGVDDSVAHSGLGDTFALAQLSQTDIPSSPWSDHPDNARAEEAVSHAESTPRHSNPDAREWIVSPGTYEWEKRLEAQAPPTKETTCDLELDIHVDDILNVHEVIREVPTITNNSRQPVHWRAVPSLREIWAEERIRMGKLLPPQDDFLSPDRGASTTTPPFTLNVQLPDSALPGTRLAVTGMKRLRDLTLGLDDNFRRVMKDIIARHDVAVQRIDEGLARRRLNSDRLAEAQEWGLLNPNRSSGPKGLTPSDQEATDTLAMLGSLFKEPSPPHANNNFSSDQGPGSSSKYSWSSSPQNFSSSQDITVNGKAHGIEEDRHSSQSERFHSLSQTYYDGQAETAAESDFELSQRMERGDGIFEGPFEYVEDFIDPETLAPFESIDEDGDDLFDLDSDSDDSAMDESRIEEELTQLATQTYNKSMEDFTDDSRSKPFDMKGSQDGYRASSGRDPVSTEKSMAEADVSDHDPASRGKFMAVDMEADNPTPMSGKQNLQGCGNESAREISPFTTSLLSSSDCHAPSKCYVEILRNPPTRKASKNSGTSVGYHPLATVGDVPPWLFFAEYQKLRGTTSSAAPFSSFPSIPDGGLSVLPTKSPPTRRAVQGWMLRERKRKQPLDSGCDQEHVVEKKRTAGASASLSVVAEMNVAINRIPRQLELPQTAELHCKEYAGRDTDQAGALTVEEVDWSKSQNLSQYQASQTGDEIETDHSTSNGGFQVVSTALQEKVRSSGDTAKNHLPTDYESLSQSMPISESGGPFFVAQPLDGIGNQGGRIWVEGGGVLKANTRSSARQSTANKNPCSSTAHSETIGGPHLPSPLSVMIIDVHVQCRSGRAGTSDSKTIALTPDSDRDKVASVIYLYGKDPGGGESLEILERGCIFIPVEKELSNTSLDFNEKKLLKRFADDLRLAMPTKVLGYDAPFSVDCVSDERQLLLRLSSVVYSKDPDMLLSWDTQGTGLGYLIERGSKVSGTTTSDLSRESEQGIDMARLLGRTRKVDKKDKAKDGRFAGMSTDDFLGEIATDDAPRAASKAAQAQRSEWAGSGLGSDWDDRVGAGAAAASIVGRLVFAGWKIIAEEVKHPNASYLPAVVATVLNRRIPNYDNLKLTEWYGHNSGRERWRVIHHKLTQAAACLLLFDALDIIGRAGEAARLSGVEFSQSFPGIRGSQYKVEGVLLRALQSLNSDERGSKKGRQDGRLHTSRSTMFSDESKSQTQSPWKMRRAAAGGEDDGHPLHSISDRNYFFFSPSLQDTNKQEALEVQAMTLEPQSGHRQDPVIVCDFTALYPSLVIAYNLCYSTCAGRLEYHTTRSEMRRQGRTTGRLGPFTYPEGRTATVLKHHMKTISEESNAKDRIYAAPTGTIFVSESVVKGVLPQVLDEILSTRAMLKKAAKQYRKKVHDLSPSILRQLEARQLALKYVANVTYGYTSATFSGRCAMPLLADTIVECGRRTLHNAIDLANSWGRDSNGKWRECEVIYGDTDSVFIRLPGRSVQEAFRFGEEFCAAVTAANPPPVQLKLEKVYLGSIMQTKKKYCGMKYEYAEQRVPVFEAKGLETIRRDQAAITQKILRNSLVTLFRSGISSVKEYLFRQWTLILSGQLPISDFILTGRVRSRYRGGRVGPVQAVLSRRLAESDPSRIIRHKERLAYVIVATPGLTFKLRDCVLTPMELLEQWDAFTIHTGYYITKHVNAALQRCLGLSPHCVDVSAWYEECPKPRQRIHFWPTTKSGGSLMISSYFGSDTCSLCGKKCKAQGRSRAAVCAYCCRDGVSAIQTAFQRMNIVQEQASIAAQRCRQCSGCFEDAATFGVTRTASRPKYRGSLLNGTVSNGIITPLANCTCIDCPNTFERHRLREAELEAVAICEALDVF